MALLINKTIQLHDELDRRAETTRKQDIQIMHQKRELRKIKRKKIVAQYKRFEEMEARLKAQEVTTKAQKQISKK
ncbi:hypothetical protein SLS61_007157 [Didymella pomorum]